jgi:hypothetical protein
MTLRRTPVGLILARPTGDEIVVKRGPSTVTVTGEPGELLLFAFGRDAVRVSFDGDQSAIAAVKGVNRGM